MYICMADKQKSDHRIIVCGSCSAWPDARCSKTSREQLVQRRQDSCRDRWNTTDELESRGCCILDEGRIRRERKLHLFTRIAKRSLSLVVCVTALVGWYLEGNKSGSR